MKRSSAQVTNYARDELEGRLVVAVVNFPPRQIGPFMSEVLCLGASDEEGRIILLEPRSGRPPRRADPLGRPRREAPAVGRRRRRCRGMPRLAP